MSKNDLEKHMDAAFEKFIASVGVPASSELKAAFRVVFVAGFTSGADAVVKGIRGAYSL